MLKALVVGWYAHGNLGDDLFQDAFKNLFPEVDFQFTDQITSSMLAEHSFVIFGGGSFLESHPQIEPKLIPQLLSKKLLFIGVGSEKTIHPQFIQLLRHASLIAVRTAKAFPQLPDLEVIHIPDLVFSLSPPAKSIPGKSILFCPNISVIPTWKDAAWQHNAWNFAKGEIAQALDSLQEKVNFFPMLNSKELSDVWSAFELISARTIREDTVLDRPESFSSLCRIFTKHQLVITQRYHGAILAEILGIPYVCIHHHDKLKGNFLNRGKFIPYFGMTKDVLLSAISAAKKQPMPIFSLRKEFDALVVRAMAILSK
jgi:polysaccharide pyruvyl transferase WcaK-like protein